MEVNISTALAKINEMVNGFIAALPSIFVAAIVFLLFFFLATWTKSLVERISDRSGLEKNASLLMGRLSRWLVIFFGILIVLSIVIPSFEPGQLIQLLGIGGIAIGFAFRDIAQNFLAGILILLTRPFRIGDQIIVNDYEGTVEEIETRATVIKTYDNRRVVIPNADLFTDSVTVNTAFEKRRSEYDVGIGYSDDIDLAKKLILEAIQNIDEVLPDPAPEALTLELGDSSINIRARWWTKPVRGEVIHAHDKVVTAIKKRLDANGVDIPFPIRTVFFNDETEVVEQNGHQTD